MPLTITYDEIRRHIGRFLLGARSITVIEADTNFNQDVEDILVSGLREFYRPRRLAPDQPFHVWSFLLRDFSVTTAASQNLVDLPEDFSGLASSLTFAAGVDQSPLSIIPDSEMRRLYARAAMSGAPKYVSIRARNTHDRSLYEVMLYPTPDAAYVLTGRYPIEPETLTDDNPYPLGGALHSETILECCLTAAEKTLNPEMGEGLHAKRFAELLLASIEADRNLLPTEAEDHAWPVDSITGVSDGLNINRAYLERLIGRLLFNAPHPATWTHNQASEVAEALRTGLRNFYEPSQLPNESSVHQWSFLKPVLRFQLTANQSAFELPAGFAMFNGPVTFAPDEDVLSLPLEITGEDRVRRKLQMTPTTGRPVMAALRVKQGTDTVYEMVVWPTSDDDYVLDLPAKIHPELVTGDKALLPGGQGHAQTIIEACLAAAEQLHPDKGQMHQGLFADRLRTSVSLDRQVNCPDSLGRNLDRSDEYDAYDIRAYQSSLVTLNGAEVA